MTRAPGEEAWEYLYIVFFIQFALRCATVSVRVGGGKILRLLSLLGICCHCWEAAFNCVRSMRQFATPHVNKPTDLWKLCLAREERAMVGFH